MEQKGQIRVAIVGSGMAGLVTAYLLNQDVRSRYAVTLFEGGDVLSLDSASCDVPNPPPGCPARVDLPMRAFAGGFYNNLRAMYDYLGVDYHAQPFLFYFSNVAARDTGSAEREKERSYFVHSSNQHRIPPVRPEGVGTVAWLMEFLYLLVYYTWFTACCFFVAPRSAGEKGVCETLDEYLHRIRLPQYFVTYYLLPLVSSVTTCSHKALLGFPATDVTDYKRRTHGAQHYTVSNGVQDVQRKLAKGIETRLSAMVSAVEVQPSAVRVCWRHMKDTHGVTVCEELFDKVVLAVSPDVAGKIFKPLQHEMAQIPTVPVESVVHTDNNNVSEDTVATRSHFSHSTAQTIHLRTSTEGIHRTESVHVQPSGALVTTCPFQYIDPIRIIKSSRFTRVLRTPESRRIVNSIFHNHYQVGGLDDEKQRAGWKNGDGGVWLVGGWCWDGMVLLEGCVVSAMRVADAFDVRVPWRNSELEMVYSD